MCSNDPINAIDPDGRKTFVEVDDEAKTITLNMFLRYRPDERESIAYADLEKLANKHKQYAEKLFGEYTYKGTNAPHDLVHVSEQYGLKGKTSLIREVVQDRGPKYAGYKVRLRVSITAHPSGDSSGVHDTFLIRRTLGSERTENAQLLTMQSLDSTVFHEYMHHLNLWDEYDRNKNSEKKYAWNWLEVYREHWHKDPEQNAIMTCGGTVLYDRYIEAALFGIDNLTREKVSRNSVFWLNAPSSDFFNGDDWKVEAIKGAIHATPH